MSTHTKILHVDGDAFFASCESAQYPHLLGKPVVVGEERGIACAFSYEAKKLGITRGMPIAHIRANFPRVVILPSHFDLYHEYADKLYRVLREFTTRVERYSIDECFALVQPSEVKYFGGVEKLMVELKKEIEGTLNVTYSFGLARTKALSKLASKLEKPNGLVLLLTEEDEVRALKTTSINNIWGIGRRTVPEMQKYGLKTAYDFINLPARKIKEFSAPIAVLQRELRGEQILKVENNIDPRDQRSIQSSNTFHPASTNPKIIWREIAENVEGACKNARELHLFSKKISFFLKTSEFKYHLDEIKLEEYTNDPGMILNAMELKLFKLIPKRYRIRSTGVIIHNLVHEEDIPRDLFGKQDKVFKNLIIEEVADKLRVKYGKDTVKRASSLKKIENCNVSLI